MPIVRLLLLVVMAACVAPPLRAELSDLNAEDPAEVSRVQRFAAPWAAFLRESLDAADERQRLAAAQLLLGGGTLAATGRLDLVPSVAELAKAADVRDAVLARSVDPVTLAIGAAGCKPLPLHDCERLPLLKRAVAVDPRNAWAWLELSAALRGTDRPRADLAFVRAATAADMRETWVVPTVAALYQPLRRSRPEIDADLALVRLMGAAAAQVSGAGWHLSERCSAQAVADAARAAHCRRLVERIGDAALTTLTLQTARSIGTRLGLAPSTLARWQAQLDTARQAHARMPWPPSDAPGRQHIARYADDLAQFGELEATRRALQRAPSQAVPLAPGSPVFGPQPTRRLDDAAVALNERLAALAADGSGFGLLLAGGINHWAFQAVSMPPLSAAQQQALRAALADTRDPAVLSFAVIRCRTRELGCDAAAAARRWTDVESDNAAAWLVLAGQQSAARSEGEARASLLRAAGAPRYTGHGTARLGEAHRRLVAVQPRPTSIAAFELAAALAAPRARLGQAGFDALCRADADADLRAACLHVARRIDDDASTAGERAMALAVRLRLGERVGRAQLLQIEHQFLAATALGLDDEPGWRAPVDAAGRPDEIAARPIIDALLAHGELEAVRRLLQERR